MAAGWNWILRGGRHRGTNGRPTWVWNIRGPDSRHPRLDCLRRMLGCRIRSFCEVGLVSESFKLGQTNEVQRE